MGYSPGNRYFSVRPLMVFIFSYLDFRHYNILQYLEMYNLFDDSISYRILAGRDMCVIITYFLNYFV